MLAGNKFVDNADNTDSEAYFVVRDQSYYENGV